MSAILKVLTIRLISLLCTLTIISTKMNSNTIPEARTKINIQNKYIFIFILSLSYYDSSTFLV